MIWAVAVLALGAGVAAAWLYVCVRRAAKLVLSLNDKVSDLAFDRELSNLLDEETS